MVEHATSAFKLTSHQSAAWKYPRTSKDVGDSRERNRSRCLLDANIPSSWRVGATSSSTEGTTDFGRERVASRETSIILQLKLWRAHTWRRYTVVCKTDAESSKDMISMEGEVFVGKPRDLTLLRLNAIHLELRSMEKTLGWCKSSMER